MKLALAFDSFKGSLTSKEVADAFSEGVKSVMPDCEFLKFDISDGGEGFIEALQHDKAYELVSVAAHDPLMRPIDSVYLIDNKRKSAVIELANVCGLTLLTAQERNPLHTSTYGVGELILDAYNRGVREFTIGIGGSATNDAGVGMLHALGYNFYNAEHKRLEGCTGSALGIIDHICDSELKIDISECRFRVLCDVTNPLYGDNGAAYIYAPQKGADIEMVERLDYGLRNISKVVEREYGIDFSCESGAGAAGGVGWAFISLLNGELQRGVEHLLEIVDFQKRVADCNYIFTGEGKIDGQTLSGKAPYGILKIAKSLNIKTIAIGGRVELTEQQIKESGFEALYEVTPRNTPLEIAMLRECAIQYVKSCAERIAEGL